MQKDLARAQRDNDLIYHKDVPSSSAITPIQDVIMVQGNLLPGLSDPKSVVSGGRIVFGELLGWGAREAVSTLTLPVSLSAFDLVFRYLQRQQANPYQRKDNRLCTRA